MTKMQQIELHPLPFDYAFVAGYFADFNADDNAFGHFGDVRDDADFSALRLQVFKRIHRYAKRVAVERAESFVYKERFYFHAVGRQRR